MDLRIQVASLNAREGYNLGAICIFLGGTWIPRAIFCVGESFGSIQMLMEPSAIHDTVYSRDDYASNEQ